MKLVEVVEPILHQSSPCHPLGPEMLASGNFPITDKVSIKGKAVS
jgi:hypothetical protein